ncbi:MAG: CRISPR-associated endoribonuclease Cas6 [Methanosarcinales archaeon]
MPYSVVIECYPQKTAILSPTLGEYIHASFFNILKETDAEFATDLHNKRRFKPFTVSPLQIKVFKKNGQNMIKQGSKGWFRITFLQDDLFGFFTKYFLEINKDEIRLEDNTFKISAIYATNSKDNEWSGYRTYEEIYNNTYNDIEIRLEFKSPTAFKRKNIAYLFPEPRLVFGSLLKKWNKYSPYQVQNSIMDNIENDVIVSRYKLQTKALHYRNKNKEYIVKGFVGIVDYKIRSRNEEIIKTINLLSDFAIFSGVGYKTPMGMGQTRRLQ